MDILQFEDLLGRLGDDLTQWPAPRQQDATDLLRVSEPARTALAAAKLLRLALRTEPVAAPAGLVDRIMQAAKQAAPAPAEKPDAGPDDAHSRRLRDGGDT